MKIFERSVDYQEHIKSHFENFRDTCSKITECIDSIYSREKRFVVLEGRNIRLNTICDSIESVTTANSTFDQSQCPEEGRIEILSALQSSIHSNDESWEAVGKCLDHHYGNATSQKGFEEICSLAQATQNNCLNNDDSSQLTVEKVFNEQLQHIQNICKGLESKSQSEIPLTVYIAVGVSVFVLLALISWLVLFYCGRMRKSKRSRKIVSNIYDQLNQEFKVHSEPRPSEVSNWSYVSVGSTILEDDRSYRNLIDPESQRVQLKSLRFDNSPRVDCKVVESTPGKPDGDVSVVSVCQYCHLEQDLEKVHNNHCLYCHANLTTGNVHHHGSDSVM